MDIKAAVEEASKELLPEKSREIYEKQYRKFNEWCASKTVENLNYYNYLMNKFVSIAFTYFLSLEIKSDTLLSKIRDKK